MKEYVFKITGETPSKKNSRITLRNGKTIPSARYRDWHKSALEEITLQKPRELTPLSESLNIFLFFTHGDLRRRDSDNGCSSILDLLQDAGIIQDDNWQIIKNISIKNGYEKNNARCYIIIQTELEADIIG